MQVVEGRTFSLKILLDAIRNLPKNLFLDLESTTGEVVIMEQISPDVFIELDRTSKRNGDPVSMMKIGGLHDRP